MAFNSEITWFCGVYIYLSSFQNRHTQHDTITCIWIFFLLNLYKSLRPQDWLDITDQITVSKKTASTNILDFEIFNCNSKTYLNDDVLLTLYCFIVYWCLKNNNTSPKRNVFSRTGCNTGFYQRTFIFLLEVSQIWKQMEDILNEIFEPISTTNIFWWPWCKL